MYTMKFAHATLAGELGGESAHQHSRNESCASALERAKSTHASALAGTKSAYQRSCVQIARKNSVRYKSVQTSTVNKRNNVIKP